MRPIATLVPEEAQELLEYLRGEAIAAEICTVIQDGGLEMSELQVPDEVYEKACTLADDWAAGKIRRLHTRRHCPKCGSGNWQSVPHDRLGYVGRCQECGCEFELR